MSIISTLTSLFKKQTIPDGVKAVENFNVKKYLGTWYEVARIDFKYEKNLNNTTATYSLNKDGSIKVVNRGYNYKTNTYKKSEGKALFVKEQKTGMLKVSFFGPFYDGYNVLAIDDAYTHALVCGRNHDYLWLLCRQPNMYEAIRDRYLKIATDNGFDINRLLWVIHDQ